MFLLIFKQEQHNAAEAKEEARQLAEAHEKRVASLEARLAEFSERIGSYDRLRQQDLTQLSKLKVSLLNYPISSVLRTLSGACIDVHVISLDRSN